MLQVVVPPVGAVQVLPQAPQLFTFVFVSTHAPLQAVCVPHDVHLPPASGTSFAPHAITHFLPVESMNSPG